MTRRGGRGGRAYAIGCGAPELPARKGQCGAATPLRTLQRYTAIVFRLLRGTAPALAVAFLTKGKNAGDAAASAAVRAVPEALRAVPVACGMINAQEV